MQKQESYITRPLLRVRRMKLRGKRYPGIFSFVKMG
jgi:hypothetical protein